MAYISDITFRHESRRGVLQVNPRIRRLLSRFDFSRDASAII